LQPDEPKSGGGGGLPIFPLIVLVVFAGLLLGGILAKFMGNRGVQVPTPAPSFTPLPTEAATREPQAVAQVPSPSPKTTPTAKPTPEPSPSATASASASAKPSATPTAATTESASASPAPTATPKAVAKTTATPLVVTPAPTPKPTVHPATPSPSPSPALITGAATSDHAAAIVRSYLNAMANGESSFATGYLRRGLPTEDFMKGGHVTSVQATANGDGSFFVTAQMVAPAGNYTENFRLENGPNGLQITDHTPSASQ
jgi:hypothetical protein